MRNNVYLILVFSCLLTGCLTKTDPPADVYTISPEWNNHRTQVDRQKKSPLIIKLSPIRATQAFTGTEILYSDSQYSWNSYVYSRWNDTPVKLLQTLFQINIEESGLFKAVVPPTSVSKADLLLESTLLNLSHHINNDGTSEGIIRIRFYLIDNTTRTVTATKEFVSKVAASAKNAKGAVGALNKAATNVAHDLVTWLAEPDRF
jgi:cholesterol transport system auxiliary component